MSRGRSLRQVAELDRAPRVVRKIGESIASMLPTLKKPSFFYSQRFAVLFTGLTAVVTLAYAYYKAYTDGDIPKVPEAVPEAAALAHQFAQKAIRAWETTKLVGLVGV